MRLQIARHQVIQVLFIRDGAVERGVCLFVEELDFDAAGVTPVLWVCFVGFEGDADTGADDVLDCFEDVEG